MPKINKRVVEAAEARDKVYDINDSDLRGFGVYVLPSGKRCYFVRYRLGQHRRRISLGYHGVLTPEQARRLARQTLAAVERGEAPADRQGGGHIVTVAHLSKRFDEEHIAVRLKPRTAKEYRRNLQLFIVPALGRLKVAEVTRADVARLHHEFRDTPYQSNRNLEIVSKMFNLAEMWGLRSDGSNPCRHVKKYKEEKRERNGDLAAARDAGLATAFVPRPAEYGPDRAGEREPTADWDAVAPDFNLLARRLEA